MSILDPEKDFNFWDPEVIIISEKLYTVLMNVHLDPEKDFKDFNFRGGT